MDVPRGVISRNKSRRWEGDSMEMDHQRESFREDKSKAVTAVDIRQFQNTVIGEGYQAKHVVRQATAPQSVTSIKDMTGGCRGKLQTTDPSSMTQGIELDTERLLQNDGLRAFRKEIENLLN